VAESTRRLVLFRTDGDAMVENKFENDGYTEEFHRVNTEQRMIKRING
jgi:hypothetical protein